VTLKPYCESGLSRGIVEAGTVYLEDSMDQPTYTEQEELQVMPWHFRAEDAEFGNDCILVATMIGDEMQTISLHVVNLPDA
jgi:hypothetical protein